MNLKKLKIILKSDIERYLKNKYRLRTILRLMILSPGFRYTFVFRICQYFLWCKYSKKLKPIYYFCYAILKHYQYKFGIEIHPSTKIGYGLRIDHYGGIVVNRHAILGDNITLRNNITIGSNYGKSPKIGNNVSLGSGSAIIGNIKLGDNIAIGANAVVVKDVPDNAVVAGIPAKIISYKGNILK